MRWWNNDLFYQEVIKIYYTVFLGKSNVVQYVSQRITNLGRTTNKHN